MRLNNDLDGDAPETVNEGRLMAIQHSVVRIVTAEF